MQGFMLILIPIVFLGGIVSISWGLYDHQNFHSACILDECPFEIHDTDSGKALQYRPTSRVQIVLDSTKYPGADFRTACNPSGVLGEVSNVPAVPAPYFVRRFEGAALGECIISDDSFSVKIAIVTL